MPLPFCYVCSWRKHKTSTVYVYGQLPASMIFLWRACRLLFYTLKLGKKLCLSGFSFQGGIKGSHQFLLPPLKSSRQFSRRTPRGTHAGIRWHPRQSPSSMAGHWRKEGTSHSLRHKYYVCNCTPACQIHSSRTRLHVRYIYTWGEKRPLKEWNTYEAPKRMQKKDVHRELKTTSGCFWVYHSKL